MTRYEQGKQKAIEKAQNWQRDFARFDLDWVTYANTIAKLEELAKKYGLIKEFKENGII